MRYSYEIINVDQTFRTMEVVYTHEIHGSMHVGVRLPFEGENIDNVIKQFAPVGYWRDKEASVWLPEVSTSGIIEETEVVQPIIEETPLQAIERLWSGAPLARLWSIQQIEQMDLQNLRRARFYTSDSSLKGFEIIGPLSNEENIQVGATSFLSLRTIVEKCKELGVPAFGITESESFITFAQTHLDVETAQIGSKTIIYTSWDESMQIARNNAYVLELKSKRDRLLLESDWINQPDAPAIVNENEWLEYRQALRDVPQQESFPNSVVWPIKPN